MKQIPFENKTREITLLESIRHSCVVRLLDSSLASECSTSKIRCLEVYNDWPGCSDSLPHTYCNFYFVQKHEQNRFQDCRLALSGFLEKDENDVEMLCGMDGMCKKSLAQSRLQDVQSLFQHRRIQLQSQLRHGLGVLAPDASPKDWSLGKMFGQLRFYKLNLLVLPRPA